MTVALSPAQPGQQHYAAMSMGARCDLCPCANLNRGPVPSTIPAGASFFVVAEAPGSTEVAQGETLIGASGREVRTALQLGGAEPSRVALVNTMACQPPGGDLKRFLHQCKKDNVPSPVDCCAPRLQRELEGAKFILCMGGASLSAIGRKGASVMSLRGTPITGQNGVQALATPHAAFVLRDEGRSMRPIFRADVAKAVRLSRGCNTWADPAYFVPRSAAEVANFLAVNRPRVAVDVETDGVDQWTCNLRRVGIGDHREVMIYSPLSVRGHMLLPQHEAQAQTRVIADYLQRAPRIDTHNGTAFDSVVMWRHGMPIVDERHYDSMIAHQIGYTSELKHGLDFCGSIYTDVPHWKDSFKHSTLKDDSILDKYLSFDIAVTHISAAYTEQNLTLAQQGHIYTIDKRLFELGRSMAALGIYIDPVKRFKFAQEYQEKSNKLRDEFVQTAGRDINPASYPQIRKLLYDDLGLPVLDEHVTDGGDPSTDENTLLDLLALGLDKRAEKIIHGLIGYREAEKILGTNTGHVIDGKLVGGPPVHMDGRLRTGWRPGKTSGRWGSSEPVNLMNIPKKLRAMFCPAPGNVFVAADMQAVELRYIAWLSDDEPLLNAFAAFDAKSGPDVHIANACMVFKCTPEQVTDDVRTFIKRLTYALNYGAEPPKIYQTLSLMRDDNLQPMFGGINLAEVERVYGIWWQLHPSMAAWKRNNVYSWRSRGFLESATHKRRRFFIGGESPTELANFPIQAGCADMQNDALIALAQAYPFDFANHRGVVVNGHDQILVECAEREAEDVKALVRSVMTKQRGKMAFPAEPKHGFDWKAVS